MQKHLGDLHYPANTELTQVVNNQLASMYIGYSQLQTLITIVQLGDGSEVDQETLAETMQVDKSNVSRNLSKMQKDGLLEIIQSDKDGRKKRIMLTDKAQGSIHALKEILNGINGNHGHHDGVIAICGSFCKDKASFTATAAFCALRPRMRLKTCMISTSRKVACAACNGKRVIPAESVMGVSSGRRDISPEGENPFGMDAVTDEVASALRSSARI